MDYAPPRIVSEKPAASLIQSGSDLPKGGMYTDSEIERTATPAYEADE